MPFDTIPLPLGGFDDREALLLDGQRSPNLQNIRLRRQRITKRPGIQRVEPGDGARVSAMAGFDNLAADPVVQLLKFGPTDELARYDFTAQAWVPVAFVPSGDPPLNDFQHWSVVNTLNYVIWAATRRQLRIYSPVPAAPPIAQVLPTNATDFTRLGAMVLIAYANRVVAVRTDEDSQLFPTRIRWCRNGDVFNWQPDPANPGAGFLDVRETTNLPLTGAFVLNGQAYLTKAKEIIPLIATGDVTTVFTAGRPAVSGRGMVAPHSIALSDYVAYGVGADNVYAWDGSSLQAIGDPIWETLSSAIFFDQEDTGRLQRIVGAFYRRRNEYWLYAPDQLDKDGNPVTTPIIFIYDAKADRWYLDALTPGLVPEWFTPVLPLDVTATPPLPLTRPREQMTTMTDTDYYWFGDGDEFRGAAIPPVSDDARLGAPPLARLPIDLFIETKDYEPQELYRGEARATLQKLNSLYEVRFQADPGARVEVWMSPDKGVNWVHEEAVVNEYGVGAAYFLHTFSTLRLRFRQLGSGPLNLRGMVQVKWQPAGWNPSLA